MIDEEKKQNEKHIEPNDSNELDQANELRKLFHEVEGTEPELLSKDDTASEKEEEIVMREIDILQLPPRKEVHSTKNRVKLKISKPLLRFIFISIVIIAVVVWAFFLLDGEWNVLFE